MKQAILRATQISYRHHRKLIVNQCNLSLYNQEVVALIGGNGAGKTTLLHLLAGLLFPDRGEIIRHVSPHTQWLGYLADKPALYPQMRVGEFLRYCAHIRGLEDLEHAVSVVVNSCQLTEVFDQRCADLSHGYQQRVGLAQAVIHQPPVVLLDEPTNGLDHAHKKAFRPLLRNLGGSAAVLMISHDYQDVIATAERVYVLHAASLQEIQLPPKEGLWWLALQETSSSNQFSQPLLAKVFAIVVDEGPFVAVERARYSLNDVYRLLHIHQIDAELHATYPVAALQARIAHVG